MTQPVAFWKTTNGYVQINHDSTVTIVEGANTLTLDPGVGISIPDDLTAVNLTLSGDATASSFTGELDGVLGGTTPAAATVTDLTASGDAVLLPLCDELVVATVTVPDTAGGGTDADLTLTLTRADSSSAVASARQVFLNTSGTQYAFSSGVSTVTFSNATTGSIVASGNGWALVQTDASGEFACTISDSADETIYIAATTPPSGVSSLAAGCVVVASNSDAATWSA